VSESGFSVSQEDDAAPEDVKTVWDGLAAYNRQFVSDSNHCAYSYETPGATW
jgi:hypothetical protein